MAKKWTQADRDTAERIQRGQNITSVVIAAVKWGAIVAIAIQARFGLGSLAGKDTNANIFLQVLADFGSNDRVVDGLLTAALVLTLFLYFRLKRLHAGTISQLGELRKEKELALDPRRSSSRLLTTGETRPEDEP